MTGQSRKLPVAREHAEAATRAVLKGDGEPLGADVRADLEPRFGADLSVVRVHADEAADASARQLKARAYTAGQHVVFGGGRYAPNTAEGRALLAHEIAHTIQQRHAGPDGHTAARADAMSDPGAESAARHAAIQALAGPEPSAAPAAAPMIAPAPLAIAREEGTAEVVDTVTNFQHAGTVFSARMQRDQFKTHADAQHAQASQGPPKQQPGHMDTGFAHIEMDATSGAVTIPVTVAVRHATDADLKLDTDGPDKRSATDISAARVQQIGDQYIAEVNAGLNNWFTLYVPPCQGVPWSGSELPITVRVTRAAKATDADFTVAVSQHTGRSWVSHPSGIVLLYAGDLGAMTMRHEGAHMALGVPDEYRETDKRRRQQAPAQMGDERVRHDWTLAGDYDDWRAFSVLRERHFSFVPAFARQVLTSLGHPECVPVLHEARRPQPMQWRLTAGYGLSTYGGQSLHLEGGVDTSRFLDMERDWRAFVGVHGQAFLAPTEGNSAFLLGARLAIEHKWRSSRTGPTVEAYGETGLATETGARARGPAPFLGTGVSVGVSAWLSGKELQLKLTGGEVIRVDAEHYQAFQTGFRLGLSW